MSWLPPDEDEPYGDYDESSVHVRPNPKANRPRSKQRPGHDDAVRGRVLTVDRGRLTVLVAEGTPEEREITAKRARELGRTAIVTGDFVDVVRRGRSPGSSGSPSAPRCSGVAPTTRMRWSASSSRTRTSS
jgi:ribosome biogenesis GTPase